MATNRASDPRAAVDLTFEELYRGYHADVYRAALRELGNVHDAEDVTQAAFVDAYRAVLRGTQPQSPRAWLLAISENVRRRRYRTSQRRPREQPIDADFPLAAELPYEQSRALAEALALLPSEQRRVFVLRELAGLSYDEIAEEVDSTVAAVQMLLFRARRSLRAELDPPSVAPRKTGLLVPAPGWLTSLLSRSEVTWLTPRAAGAVGAAVIAVVGTGVAVTEAPADGTQSPADPQPHVTSVARTAKANPLVAPTARRATSVSTKPRTVARVERRQRPAPRSAAAPIAAAPIAAAPIAAAPVTAAPVTAAPVAAVADPQPTAVSVAVAPVSTLIPPTSEVLPAAEQPRLPVPLPLPEEKLRGLLEPPVPPPPSTAPVLGAAAGAVGAAGAGPPPLPSLPLETLPPTP